LDALICQEKVGFPWEVVIVDNRPSPVNEDQFQDIMTSYPFSLVYTPEKRPGLHYARHGGALAAQGEFLAYIDDDEVPCPTWMSAVLYLMKDEADAVGGKVLPLWKSSPPDWIDIFWNTCPHGRFCAPLGLIELGEKVVSNIHPFLIFGGNFFISRHLLIHLKGFHPDGMPDDLLRFRGDGENALMVKLLTGRYRNMYDPNATAFHVVPEERMTFPYFKHRHYIQGISDSFSDIRKAGMVTDNKPVLGTNATIPDSLRPIWDEMAAAYAKGWNFHRQEIVNDPELLSFVLKDHFWDDLDTCEKDK
jgi:glycosyltransferase involved in cell wall biosynthesis